MIAIAIRQKLVNRYITPLFVEQPRITIKTVHKQFKNNSGCSLPLGTIRH